MVRGHDASRDDKDSAFLARLISWRAGGDGIAAAVTRLVNARARESRARSMLCLRCGTSTAVGVVVLITRIDKRVRCYYITGEEL